MATDVGVGDAEVGFLDVAPADGTTEVLLTVNRPTGDPYDITMTGGALVAIPGTSPVQYSQRWTADYPVVYDEADRWVLHYEVTGTGEGAEDFERYVVASAVAGGWPAWAPALTDVAIHVPYLTVDTTTPGSATYLGTFTTATSPTTAQADRHVVAAVTSVAAAVGTVNTALSGQARIVAALRAAAAILRAYPRDPSDPNERAIAADLDRRADAELERLIVANGALNEEDPYAYGLEIAPMWSSTACW